MNLSAHWIWMDRNLDYEKKICHFRREFVTDTVPDQYEIVVSADSMYQLYVNEQYVLRGPCKGDRFRKYVDRVDIAPYLKKGKNVIAAMVAYFPNELLGNLNFENGPTSLVTTGQGGFLLAEAAGQDQGFDIGTDERWTVQSNAAYTFRSAILAKYAGDMEDVDAERFPFDWYREHTDASKWKPAVIVSGAANHVSGGLLNNWRLQERDIPLLEEREIRPQSVLRASSTPIPWHDLLLGKPVTIPEHENVWVEIDVGYVTTSYMKTWVEDGDRSSVRWTYAESYIQGFTPDGAPIKDVRDDIRGQLWGESDTLLTRKGVQYYEPLLYRTFRFVRLDIATGSKPLTIRRLILRETGYPLEVEGEWTSSDSRMQSLWDISVRTLRRCMHDSYIDCPYYEQMQYTMDTMLQMLFTYQISRDDRLAKKAIHDFHSSLMPDGMIACNWPSKFIQIIPGFAFYWIMMLEHHYMHFKDSGLVYQYLPTVEHILRYFEARVDSNSGLMKDAGYWQFVDWTEQWTENFGSPVKQGQVNIIYNLMFIYGLQTASRLNRYAGYADRADGLITMAENLKQAVRKHAWSQQKGLFRDAPSLDQYSQHAQVWAVLAEVVTGEEARRLMQQCMENEELAQCSFSMSFFLFRALEKVQLYGLTEALWTRWIGLLDKHVTTWPEDFLGQRSDCHAWGAVPLYEFMACILGVKPLRPGYEEIEIKPLADYVSEAEGAAATPRGPVRVRWERKRERYRLWARLPRPCRVVITLPDGSTYVREGEQEIYIDHQLKVHLMHEEQQNEEAVQ